MACCSIKRATRTSWASMALVCVPLHLLGVPLLGLLWLPALVHHGLRGQRDALACLLVRNRRVMDERLRGLRWRCVVAGRLLPVAPRVAGLVFRRFYAALAVSTWLAVAGAGFGLLVALWRLG